MAFTSANTVSLTLLQSSDFFSAVICILTSRFSMHISVCFSVTVSYEKRLQ